MGPQDAAGQMRAAADRRSPATHEVKGSFPANAFSKLKSAPLGEFSKTGFLWSAREGLTTDTDCFSERGFLVSMLSAIRLRAQSIAKSRARPPDFPHGEARDPLH